ncbi:MAG: hypothetical protein MUO85_06205 [candidate division Zixibacteria bacterium]|nr:hypothetical protein [candidate division Zixibacteria bacterium]
MFKDLFPKEPFFDRIEFKGNLTKHDEVADGIHFVVQYPLSKQGEVVGKAFGDRSTYRRLERIFTLPERLFKLTSEKHEDIIWEIYSEKVLVPRITGRGCPTGYGEGITSQVADLRFMDLTIIQHTSPSESQERHLTFFLAGPRTAWAIYQTRERSFTGETRIEVGNSKIELNEPFPFEIEVVHWYFYDKASTHENTELSTDVLALHLKTDKTVANLSNEDFIGLGRALADDLTLLISFMSKRWVTWFRYELATNDGIKTYIRRTRECGTREVDPEDCLVELYKAREFLKIGLTNLRKLRSEDFDLSMPIVYFVSANKNKYLEEQFTTYFLSLERVKDMFAKEEKLQKNLPNTAFEKLRSSIGDLVDGQVKSSDVCDRIRTKILELNRPSLRYVLESLLSKYGVIWEDLYPAAAQFTLIKTRDELFHSSREIDIDLLVKERDRLRALLERILIRMLGWEDLSRSPVDFIRRWLTAPLKKNQRDGKDNDLG